MTTCPFCLAEIESVMDVDGWAVYQPCGHPAPVRDDYESLADLMAAQAGSEAVLASMQKR